MGLKLLHRSPLEQPFLRAKFHEKLQSSSEVISRDTETDRQTGDLISRLSFCKVG
jgi:hypothetical protein